MGADDEYRRFLADHTWRDDRFTVKHPSWEPSARIAHARNCVGDAQQRAPLRAKKAATTEVEQASPPNCRSAFIVSVSESFAFTCAIDKLPKF